MKPSERLEEIFIEKMYQHGFVAGTLMGGVMIFCRDVIGKFLDEQSLKPKYACPNCHRVVDEILKVATVDSVDGRISVYDEGGITVKLVEICKYCGGKK